MNGLAATRVVFGRTGRVCRGPVNLPGVPGIHKDDPKAVAPSSVTHRFIQGDAACGMPRMT